MNNLKRLSALALAFLFLVFGWQSTQAANGSMGEMRDLELLPADFAGGTQQHVLVTVSGLALEPEANTGSYLSPVLDSPMPFNAIVPHWIGTVPELTSLSLRLRTGTDNGRWSEWFQLSENDDWAITGDPENVGQMIAVPGAERTHQKIQYSVTFSRYDGGTSPILHSIRLAFINSANGPTAQELMNSQIESEGAQPESADGTYPKPFVISRNTWCTDPRCNYSDGLKYHPVSHLIVHHTVSSNSSTDWAAVVRAIWLYHYSRGCPDNCWGDIGYNYLVDMNGLLYEGHLGGDNVVGIHAGGANTGSLGLAFIGTFTAPDYPNLPGIAPPPAMKDSAAELFAWKADKNGIDVYGSSKLPYVDRTLPHLMGHRDVYGTTECPGDQAYNILPWLRSEVTKRINSGSTTIYIDELSSDFSKSSTSYWYVPPNSCGYEGHAFYTWSVTNPALSTNWGVWRPNIPAEDNYEVEVFAPYCITGRSETDGATYKISHAWGVNEVVVSHEQNVGSWMSLGTFHFKAGQSGSIYLNDLTTTDSGLGVWFDAIRLRPSSDPPMPTAANDQPKSDLWLKQRTVSFNWSITSPSLVSKTRLVVSKDPDFKSVVLSKDFTGAVSTFEHTFSQDYKRLYWRIILTSTNNGKAYSASTFFGIDTEAPVSKVDVVAILEDGQYVIGWSGTDATSGISKYNVDYREEGASWQSLFSNTQWTSAYFPHDPTKEYEFRSQAFDYAGYTEGVHASPDHSTRDAVMVNRVIIFPLFVH